MIPPELFYTWLVLWITGGIIAGIKGDSLVGRPIEWTLSIILWPLLVFAVLFVHLVLKPIVREAAHHEQVHGWEPPEDDTGPDRPEADVPSIVEARNKEPDHTDWDLEPDLDGNSVFPWLD